MFLVFSDSFGSDRMLEETDLGDLGNPDLASVVLKFVMQRVSDTEKFSG